jgi:hypothetical protein
MGPLNLSRELTWFARFAIAFAVIGWICAAWCVLSWVFHHLRTVFL